MIRRLGRAVVLHSKYGSGLILIGVDLAVAALMGFDLIAFRRVGIDYFAFSRRVGGLQGFGFTSLFRFIVLLVLPVAVALIVNFLLFRYAPRRYYRRTSSSTRRTWLLLLHLVMAVLATHHLSVAAAATRAGGLCGALGSEAPCFVSRLGFLDDKLFLGVSLVTFLLVPLYSVVVKDSLYKSHELLREIAFWRLIGPAGEYQPEYGDELIYVNSASMAPSIKSINAALRTYNHDYQKAVPTSDVAKKFLLTKANDARRLLYEYLLPGDPEQKKLLNIEFFPGTSRALEVGLLRLRDLRHVVFSQYEHPSQVDVVRWLGSTRVVPTCAALLAPGLTFFQEPWETQKRVVCDAILKEVQGRNDGKVAIVLSEVHYITGIEVRISELMEELRPQCANAVFVVDGSQAVGNIQRPLGKFAAQMAADDFYYFSGHKWLLSPNTCGVLISRARAESIKPYDAFGFELPTSTVDPNTILGLVSALEFLLGEHRWLERTLFGRLSSHSWYSRDYFLELVRDGGKVEVVLSVLDEINSSLFAAVRPKSGYRWKADMAAFWSHMRKCGVDLTVIPETRPYFERDAERLTMDYLLRISFPYFLIGADIRSLTRHIEAFLVPVNR